MRIGISADVAKGKSTICIMTETGEILYGPVDVMHNREQLEELSSRIKELQAGNEVRVLIEATGIYHLGIASYLHEKGFFVTIENPLVLKKYKDSNNWRGVKTDNIDSVCYATYVIEKWINLREMTDDNPERKKMKNLTRQYLSYMKCHVRLLQNLDHIIDQVMPGIKSELDSHDPVTGKDPLCDFLEVFWHADQVKKMGLKRFEKRFLKMAKEKGYRPRNDRAGKLYSIAAEGIPTVEADDFSRQMVQDAISALRAVDSVLYRILTQLRELAQQTPEYDVVREMGGVGETLAPLLIGEIGDPRRYYSGKALVACAGIDVPPYESGQFKASERKITRKGSKYLRKIGYQVIRSIKTYSSDKDPAVHDFYQKLVSKGKNKKAASVAAMNKFLTIYYARTMEVYAAMETEHPEVAS
ncbi:MAG: IS110 family transposase [Prevotella sp.]|nr:IS110 family transposase [Prevotella sp.]